MNKVKILLLFSLLITFVNVANALTGRLDYKITNAQYYNSHSTEKTFIFTSYGQGPYLGRDSIDIPGGEFCLQHELIPSTSSYAIYKFDDMSKPASIVDNGDFSSIDDFSKVILTNAHQEGSANGYCPYFAPDAGIQYQVRNNTTLPLTFLKVFTTENTGVSGVPVHIDDPVLLNGKLDPNVILPTIGWTGWYNAVSHYEGTRWYILFSHGNDCKGTSLSSGDIGDGSNLFPYIEDDLKDQDHPYTTMVSIADCFIGIATPSRAERLFSVEIYPLSYCKQ